VSGKMIFVGWRRGLGSSYHGQGERERKDRHMTKSGEDSSGEPDLLLPEEWVRMKTACSEMAHS